MFDNSYQVMGDTTVIDVFLKRKTQFQTIVDTEILPELHRLGYRWRVAQHKVYKSLYVIGHGGPEKYALLHRIVANAPKGYVVDHINHDTLDNRRRNLRICTNQENQQNRKGATKASKSGIRGVSWKASDRRWRAQIQINKKVIHLGSFTDIDEAARAVKEAREKLMPFSIN